MTIGLIKINNIDCSNNITKMQIKAADLHDQDSGRATNGIAYVNIVRYDQMELALEWQLVDDDYKNTILGAIGNGKDIPVDFTYDGTDFGKHIEASYRGNRTVDFVGVGNTNGTKRLWNISFSLIEQ